MLELVVSIVMVGAGVVFIVMFLFAHLILKLEVLVLNVSSVVLVGVLSSVLMLMFMLLVVLAIIVVSVMVLARLSDRSSSI